MNMQQQGFVLWNGIIATCVQRSTQQIGVLLMYYSSNNDDPIGKVRFGQLSQRGNMARRGQGGDIPTRPGETLYWARAGRGSPTRPGAESWGNPTRPGAERSSPTRPGTAPPAALIISLRILVV